MKRSIVKKVIAAAAAAFLLLGLAACSGSGSGSGKTASNGTVAILMPGLTVTRWAREAGFMSAALKKQGISTIIEYANNDAPTQVSQIENMIVKGVKAIIVSPVDSGTLGNAVADAAKAKIPVIAYARPISNTKNVDYLATFDYGHYAALSSTALLEGLGIIDSSGKATGTTKKFNIELVGGDPGDANARIEFNGGMKVLKPYIDNGTLTVGSGQTSFLQTVTVNWDGANAETRMQNILAKTYTGGKHLDGVWVAYDGLTRGVISALQAAGYKPGTDWPILTGGDAELPSVKDILADEQYSTVYTDYKSLADDTASVAADLVLGKKQTVTIVHSALYNNGAKDVPTILSSMELVTKANVQKALVDSGFYTAAQVGQ